MGLTATYGRHSSAAKPSQITKYTFIPGNGRRGSAGNASVYAIVVVYSLDGLRGADLLTASGAPAGGWK